MSVAHPDMFVPFSDALQGAEESVHGVQAMVYGNFNDSSCTGVCFTRNPATGQQGIYGEFLVNAQGEDVVAGAPPPLAQQCLLHGVVMSKQ